MPTIAPVAAWQRHHRFDLAVSWQRRRQLALAKGLERVGAEAERRYVPSAAVPVNRRAVRECRTSLLELAAAVRAADAPRRSQLLLVRRLLIDTTGPLYHPASPEQLRSATDFARTALEGRR